MMGWTKQQFVVQAFEEIGLADYVYNLQPEQLQAGLRRLDAMMATWNGKSIRIGYPLPSSPGSSALDDETDVPDIANEAIYTNLAIRVAPIVGKAVATETKVAAREGYKALLAKAAMPNEMQLPGSMPTGAGQKLFDKPFIDPPVDTIDAGVDSAIDFE